jgi:lysozyme
MSLIENLTNQLRRDEGEVLHAYQDHLGFWTIGIGRLIDKRKGGGLTKDEAAYLLGNDIARFTNALRTRLPWFDRIDEARQGVLANMAFQMGVEGLLGFRNTLGMIERGEYDAAANAMLQSKWAQQTPQRAARLAQQMRTGEWQ